MMTIQVLSEKTQYAADFERFDRLVAAPQPPWLRDLRRRAIERFEAVGFPTARRGNEEWKYTSVTPIARGVFSYSFETPPVQPSAIRPYQLGRDWPRLVFVDGWYRPRLSSVAGLPPGVAVLDLAEAVSVDPETIEARLARLVPPEGDGFAALNAAFLHHGAFVGVPAGIEVDRPIHLLFVSTGGSPMRNAGEQAVGYPRLLVVAGAGSKATIVESHVGLTDTPYLTDPVTEIAVGAGARLTHYKLALEGEGASHVATTQVRQERDSTFTSVVFTAGGRLVRNSLNVTLDGEGAETTLNGLYLTSGTQHVDHHTFIDHARPRTTSRELYKGIVDGKSRAVFSGRILVRRDAQKADARQTNKNLVLSAGAEVDTKPFLEIFADDVKCSHGATAGKLDETSLFFLRARGLDPERARDLLAYAFASEIVNLMALDPVRAKVERLLLRRLPSLEPKG